MIAKPLYRFLFSIALRTFSVLPFQLVLITQTMFE